MLEFILLRATRENYTRVNYYEMKNKPSIKPFSLTTSCVLVFSTHDIGGYEQQQNEKLRMEIP
jgi:hypothetical protein